MPNYNHKHFYVIIFNAHYYSKFICFENKSEALIYKNAYEEAADDYGGYPSVYIYPTDDEAMSYQEEYTEALTAIGKQ